MVENPQSVVKKYAKWVIGSTLLSRVFGEQRLHGLFYLLWADLDHVIGLTFNEIVGKIGSIVTSDFVLYTSKSATKENPKCRFIAFLSEHVPGSLFIILQKILNDKLEEMAGLTPDRVTERAGELCYLPNRGEYYEHFILDLIGPFDPSTWNDEIESERMAQKADEEALRSKLIASRERAKDLLRSGMVDPYEAFNLEYPIPLLFEKYGYERRGDRWLSPLSESGNPGVTLTKDERKWLSAHGSDAAAGLGKPTANGCMGDGVDLYCHFEHANDRKKALDAVKDMLITETGETVREFNDRVRDENILEGFQGIGESKGKSFRNFILNGESKTMELQMLDDVFVLGRLALMGQMSVFYSKPNVGKTLLTIRLLITSIKEGRVIGKDVFYLNADDSHKGLITKLKLAEEYGFNMLAPGYRDFKAGLLIPVLRDMIDTDSARGKILILDTAKKFVNLMKKDESSKFAEHIRQFVLKGGTVIMLAHTNKHRDNEGKVVFAGTSDLVDDCDCAYTIDIEKEDKFEGIRTIRFENFKCRGDVAKEAIYDYDASQHVSYEIRLNSVRLLRDAESEAAKEKALLEKRYFKNKEVIDAIKDVLRDYEPVLSTKLVQTVFNNTAIPRRTIFEVLKQHTGTDEASLKFWTVERREKNSKYFTLN